MVSGPNVHGSMEKLFTDTLDRLTIVERRLATQGGGGDGGNAVFAAGTVSAWAGPPSTVPDGWLICDGRALSRTQFPALFAAIGTTYGAGDGSTTFNIPNGKGRFLVGQDGAQVEFDTVGETGGAKTHRHDFRFGLFDRNWQPAGSYAGMETVAGGVDNKMGAYRYSTGQFQGASQGSPATSSVNLANNSAPAAGSVVQSLLNRMETTGDTATPAGTTGLPPYLVHTWIISTGAGSAATPAPVVQVALWNEFTLAKPGGLRPIVGGAVVWDGPVTGTLGATLAADKATITLPVAGTYRIVSHLGLAAANGNNTTAALYVSGTALAKSQTYGAAGPSGVFVPTVEVTIQVSGPTTFTQGVSAPLGMYDWTWLRIEKVEPTVVSSVMVVQKGSTGQRDFTYPPPTNAVEQASLANRVVAWYNTDRGWFETYYAPTGTVGLTVPALRSGFPAGWYPEAGAPIYASLKSVGNQAFNAGTAQDLAYGQTLANHAMTLPGTAVVPLYAGDYQINGTAVYAGPAAGYFDLRLFVGGINVAAQSGTQFPHTNAYSRADIVPVIYPVQVGESVRLNGTPSGAGSVQSGSAMLTVRYVGPPFG